MIIKKWKYNLIYFIQFVIAFEKISFFFNLVKVNIINFIIHIITLNI